MPVYNGGRHLSIAIDSILTQSFEDFELVISDNASTDDTEAVCRAYAAGDPRVRYVRQSHNIGANPNWNAVRILARGKYFKWASANDRCDASFLAACVGVLEAHREVVLCYSETQLIDDDDRPLEVYDDPLAANADDPAARFLEVMDRLDLNNAFSGVIRSSALREVGELKAYFGSDLPLMAALALRGKFHRTPGALFHRRIGPESHTSARRDRGAAEAYRYGESQILLRRFGDYFFTVARAPVSAMQKARLVGGLLRRMNWCRRSLGIELLEALTPKRHARS
jgi:glycosyltransferase involved in cell wall biosynthesis